MHDTTGMLARDVLGAGGMHGIAGTFDGRGATCADGVQDTTGIFATRDGAFDAGGMLDINDAFGATGTLGTRGALDTGVVLDDANVGGDNSDPLDASGAAETNGAFETSDADDTVTTLGDDSSGAADASGTLGDDSIGVADANDTLNADAEEQGAEEQVEEAQAALVLVDAVAIIRTGPEWGVMTFCVEIMDAAFPVCRMEALGLTSAWLALWCVVRLVVLVVVATAIVGTWTVVTADGFAVIMVAAAGIGCETTVGLTSCLCMQCACDVGTAEISARLRPCALRCGLDESRSFSSMASICVSRSFCCIVGFFREFR